MEALTQHWRYLTWPGPRASADSAAGEINKGRQRWSPFRHVLCRGRSDLQGLSSKSPRSQPAEAWEAWWSTTFFAERVIYTVIYSSHRKRACLDVAWVWTTPRERTITGEKWETCWHENQKDARSNRFGKINFQFYPSKLHLSLENVSGFCCPIIRAGKNETEKNLK